MFKPEDFELPLEQKLKLRVVNDDIDKCTDIEAPRENLKASTKLLMNYQRIIHAMVKEQIEKDLTDFGIEIKQLEEG